jgi:putative peptidoglycan lipid II flippase
VSQFIDTDQSGSDSKTNRSAKRPSLGRTFSVVALLSVVSKVIGLARDVVVASAYGTSVLADAYNYAYLFTGNILILFGGLGGPFHSATVTTLTPRKDAGYAGAIVTQIVFCTVICLSLAMILVWVFAPNLVHIVAANYGGDVLHRAKFFEETTLQLRLMSPLLLLAGLVGISYGVLNVYDKIFWPSLSPAIASVVIILVLTLFPNKESSLPLAAGTLVGAFGQLFAQLPQMMRCGLHFQLLRKPQEGVRDYVSVLWPAVFGTSIGQLTLYVDSYFCSGIGEGSWTAIANANRLVQLPLGVLITAMLVPALPRFTEHASANNHDDLKAEFRRALSFLTFLAMPLTVILLVIPEPIVRLLFQRGAFNQSSTVLVSQALLFLVPSIIFYIGRDLITRVFYSLQDSKTPYYVAMLAIVVKALLDWLFVMVYGMGVSGISLATSAITIFNLSLLTVLLKRKLGHLGLSKLLLPSLIMFVAAVASGIAIFQAHLLMGSLIKSELLVWRALVIAIDMAIGGLVYLFLCAFLKLPEPLLLMKRFTDRFKK